MTRMLFRNLCATGLLTVVMLAGVAHASGAVLGLLAPDEELAGAAPEDLLFLDKDLAYEILWSFVKILSTRLRETNDKMTFLSVTGKF